MFTIDSQLHGYRQGHQLLASSISLPKTDQLIIDRLSDVAGPLRPSEKFEPYVSAYPLPSGSHYVLARTWQDLTIARAGCARTLSLVIPTPVWASANSLTPFFEVLNPKLFPSTAETFHLSGEPSIPLPATPTFHASELLEALFLEEAKPVAIFDAPLPELIAIRLLSALWPSLRSRFALSTFALSPRKIEGRSFDLVFAPKDARPKFADWPGRRIDARTVGDARHRWTGVIVDRVFNAPSPWLLGDRKVRIIETDDSNATAALRIALLWDELVAKLDQSPTAALGLLDIADSRRHRDPDAVLALEPSLAEAAHRAVASLPASEAWDFIGAMVRKMHGTQLKSAAESIAAAAGLLASRWPSGAIELLDQPDPQGAIHALMPQIAKGINRHFDPSAEQALRNARPDTLSRLIIANEGLAKTVAAKSSLIERLAEILPKLSPQMLDSAREALLPFLVNDPQIAAARPLVASLDSAHLMAEVRHLAEVNEFAAISFIEPLVERAQQLHSIDQLREVLLAISPSLGRDHFLLTTLTPTAEDVNWLLEEPRFEPSIRESFLIDLLRRADMGQFHTLFSYAPSMDALLLNISTDAPDLLLRALNEVQLPLAAHIATTKRLLPVVSAEQKIQLAQAALSRCLSEHLPGDEVATISMLLGTVGRALDGGAVARSGLNKNLAASVVNRNLVAFHVAPKVARQRIVDSVYDIAQVLTGRYELELDEPGASACAQILLDAESANPSGLLRASALLLPTLLRSRRAPVSAIVAVAFPTIYLELAKENSSSELLNFIPFLGRDRCKAARRDLVSAFLRAPIWAPSDLSLIACRSKEVDAILMRVEESYGGGAYVNRIKADLAELREPCRRRVASTIVKIQSDGSSKHR